MCVCVCALRIIIFFFRNIFGRRWDNFVIVLWLTIGTFSKLSSSVDSGFLLKYFLRHYINPNLGNCCICIRFRECTLVRKRFFGDTGCVENNNYFLFFIDIFGSRWDNVVKLCERFKTNNTKMHRINGFIRLLYPLPHRIKISIRRSPLHKENPLVE